MLVQTVLRLCRSAHQGTCKLHFLLKVFVCLLLLDYILRNADLVEEEDNMSEQIQEYIHYLRRDEQGTKEGPSHETALKIERERQQKQKELEEAYHHVD